MLLMFNSLE